LVEAGQASSGSYATLAETLRRTGDRTGALDTFRLATAGDDVHLDAQVGVARCLGLLGDFDGAEKHLRELVRRYVARVFRPIFTSESAPSASSIPKLVSTIAPTAATPLQPLEGLVGSLQQSLAKL